MTELFEYEAQEGMKRCKCCMKELPLDKFYVCGNIVQAKCIECTKIERKAKLLYPKYHTAIFEKWPEELQQYAEYFYYCQADGGKINYKNSPAATMVVRYMAARGIAAQDEPAVSGEVLLALTMQVSDLERRVDKLEAFIQNSEEKSEKKKDAQEIQERRNLLNKISMNPLLVEILGSDEDANKFCEKLADAARKVKSLGYLPGSELRNILVEFEAVQEPFFDDILVFYAKFIQPGVAAAQSIEDYSENAELTKELLGYNAYEIDWNQVPLSKDMQ